MNDRSASTPARPKRTPTTDHIDLALPAGSRVRGFEIQTVISSSASTTVYLAADLALELPMAVQEYLPLQFVQRDAMWVRATDAWHEDLIARGLRAFMGESRMLAHADHPALIRVHQLFEANGTAYRVMPLCAGRRLAELRQDMVGAPDEASLRALIEGLLGALEAIHRNGGVHGGVSPANVLLLADDRPMLLSAGAAGREIGSDLVDSLMATLESAAPVASPPNGGESEGTPPSGPSLDLYALADTVRFCITAEAPSSTGTLRHREPLAKVIAREFPLASRPNYSQPLLQTLDAALSPFPEDRPLSAVQFREWLTRGVPGGALRVHAAPAPAPAAAPAHAPLTAPISSPKRASASAVPRAPAATANDEIDVSLDIPASRFEHDANEPIGSWPDTAFRPMPVIPERAPWVAPPAMKGGLVKRRGVQALLAVGLLGAAIAVLAIATGAWDQMPEISLDNSSSTTTSPGNDATPRAANPPQAIDPPAAVDNSAERTAIVNATTANATAASASAPAPEPTPMPGEAAAARTAATPTPAADTPEAAPAKAAATEVAPPNARPKTVPPAAAPAAPPTRAPASVPAPAATPRAACAGRTEFALYRCMQQQCQATRFTSHPQCVTLRRDDKVE
jgi:serine/threonine protein kinase